MRWSIGSTWHRWDPHIHAPGTLKENQYGPHTDAAVWNRYFATIREAQPECSAIGITDYFVPRGYRLFIEHGGRVQLPGLFVFPNVELRLVTRTLAGPALNVHLLVSPDDPDHLGTLAEKLSALTFRYDGDDYRCTEADLRRLGKRVKPELSNDDEGALRAGAERFLVNDEHFVRLKEQAWIRQHVLFAVPAGNDGLSGLKGDAFKAFREELGRIADVVFSGSPNEVRYWRGEHEDAAQRISGVKPCLHGSDAHGFDRILAPEQDRRSWVRGSPTFDGLRQTLIEPRRRVFIGAAPDSTRSNSNVISKVRLRNAPWFEPTEFLLNDGLVTVIGERGSGKTALADLIALAADARDQETSTASFLQRAGDLLANVEVELEWADGSTSPPRGLMGSTDESPRVRYLSQQFVERLSQRERITSARHDDIWVDEETAEPADPLLEEIERVVFEAIPIEDRMEAESFTSLRDARLGDHLEARRADRETIRRVTEAIAAENTKKKSVDAFKKAADEATRARTALEKELIKLPTTAPPEHVKSHQDAVAAYKTLQDAIQQQSSRAQRLQSLRSALQQEQARIDTAHQDLCARYPDLLDDATWERLRPKLDQDALSDLETRSNTARNDERRLREQGTTQQPQVGTTVAGLQALADRVAATQKTLGEDETKSKRRIELVKNLDAARITEEKAKKSHADSEGAGARITAAGCARSEAYQRLLQTLDAEVATLNELYEPLKRRLIADERLRQLSFEVSRHVDLIGWAASGEQIFDLRHAPFRGRGGLLEVAQRLLEPVWRGGSPDAVRMAIDKFYADNLKAPEYRQGKSILDLGQWLFSTDHISIRYAIKYEGRDIASLSPGARGVVLLTLFLAIDDHDDRPLVIDQPEENLDPKSINGLLVPFFVEAAKRRQIIMVTHNANLVVNTDADQVIVAKSDRSETNDLPNFKYEAGGLEVPHIRTLVCQYLEGGEEAFRRRAERYGDIVKRGSMPR
jgi:ABC-type lipoprotein export system ATPase subunit